MRAVIVAGLLLMGCGPASALEVGEGWGEVEVLPTCGPCFRVIGDLCVDDATCEAPACADARPDLTAMSWANDPALNFNVDFGCR